MGAAALVPAQLAGARQVPPPAVPPPMTITAWPGDFPDPEVVWTGTEWFAFSTNHNGVNVPTLRSADLLTWEPQADAMPVLPAWADPGQTWAPAVEKIRTSYVMYFAARDRASKLQCIGRASSPTPQGPYVDASTGPMICQRDRNGSIDPSPYVDLDGVPYLLWKSEGIVSKEPTRVWVQRLAPDGLSLIGDPVELIQTDLGWEEPIVENPSMVRDGDRYFVFYSANRWFSDRYSIGFAVCETVLGPCVKPLADPWMQTNGAIAGPGAPDFFTDGRGTWISYHAWTAPDVGYPQGARSLRVSPVWFDGGWPLTPGSITRPRLLPPDDVVLTMAAMPNDDGYQVLTTQGHLNVYGAAPALGSASEVPGARWIVDLALSPSGQGYWQIASDGGIFSYGDAGFHGSTGNLRLNKPIVGMAPTASGRGYWLVASDGGIFAFGDAVFHGSTGSQLLIRPITGMAPTPNGDGYWLVASDGSVFTFGSAPFYGSLAKASLRLPVVELVPTSKGTGYWLVAADGGVFAFGQASFLGAPRLS